MLIDKEKFIDDLENCSEIIGRKSLMTMLDVIKNQPAVKAVPLEVAKQIIWERDIAIEQLHDVGVEFGSADGPDVVPIGEWIYVDNDKQIQCSRCKCRLSNYTTIYKADGYLNNHIKYCPNCGSKNR